MLNPNFWQLDSGWKESQTYTNTQNSYDFAREITSCKNDGVIKWLLKLKLAFASACLKALNRNTDDLPITNQVKAGAILLGEIDGSDTDGLTAIDSFSTDEFKVCVPFVSSGLYPIVLAMTYEELAEKLKSI